MPSDASDIAHLLRRVGFAALPAEINALVPLSWNDAVAAVLDTSGAVDPAVGVPDLNESRDSYDRYVDMVWFWLERARTTPAPIVEKMVLFWHGHFCSSFSKVGSHEAMFDQNQLFRTNGLGDFRELTRQVSLQPAMIAYLDNDRNVLGSPNENFARELMELFTLGIGNYTEDDVRESARAWTGHGLDDDNDAVYRFYPEDHDGGTKAFFGQTGTWDGPDIINLILDQKRSGVAEFIGAKLWSFLAYPDPAASVVSAITATFATTLNITDLIRDILLHPEFRSTQAKQGLVRSPIEFAVAAMRHTNLGCDEANPQWSLRSMGQEPFRPPNVAGWKQNEYWISSSATWAKSGFASGLRWKQYSEPHLVFDDVEIGYELDAESNPLRDANGDKIEVAAELDAYVQLALDRFGLSTASDTSRTALRNYLDSERAGWARRAGLLMLPLLTPDFQLA